MLLYALSGKMHVLFSSGIIVGLKYLRLGISLIIFTVFGFREFFCSCTCSAGANYEYIHSNSVLRLESHSIGAAHSYSETTCFKKST